MQHFGSPTPTVSTPIVNELGQSTESAVSQKLLTDTVGNLYAAVFINQKDGEALKLWVGSQSEYDVLPSKDAKTLYMVQA